MAGDPFEIKADGVDSAALVAEIQDVVRAKMEQGAYADPRISRAEQLNLDALKDDERFTEFYLDCLRDGIEVDINDFEIVERRRSFAGLLVKLKKSIWNLLKFYTYRMWSQQNQINGFLLSATESSEHRTLEKMQELDLRVRELERRLSDESK